MADISIQAFSPELLVVGQPLEAKLRSDGYDVDLWAVVGEMFDPADIGDWALEFVLAMELSARYPRLKRYLKDWFLEIPEQSRKRVRATFVDEHDRHLDEMRLPDDLD